MTYVRDSVSEGMIVGVGSYVTAPVQYAYRSNCQSQKSWRTGINHRLTHQFCLWLWQRCLVCLFSSHHCAASYLPFSTAFFNISTCHPYNSFPHFTYSFFSLFFLSFLFQILPHPHPTITSHNLSLFSAHTISLFLPLFASFPCLLFIFLLFFLHFCPLLSSLLFFLVTSILFSSSFQVQSGCQRAAIFSIRNRWDPGPPHSRFHHLIIVLFSFHAFLSY